MNGIQQKRILYAADIISEALDVLGAACEIVMAEIESISGGASTSNEDAEYDAFFDIMAFVERLDKDLEVLYAVKQFPATSAKKSSEVSLFKEEV